MNETWNGIYECNALSIRDLSEKEWIIEPKWKNEVIENFKNSKDFLYSSTIKEKKYL